MPRNSDSAIRNATSQSLKEAAWALKQGLLVAFPTETVYGLGGNATCDRAVAAIFSAKNRPAFNPLIIHCPDTAAARQYGIFDTRAETLAAQFWPGPLTLVLKRQPDSGISPLATAQLDTLAIRVPHTLFARKLLKYCEFPLAAPSANPSGYLSPTTAQHVKDGLKKEIQTGHLSFILDGGACGIGLESSVVDLTADPPLLLRPGGIPVEEIEAVIGPLHTLNAKASDRPRSPGCLTRHYAPRLPLRLEATSIHEGEALLSFGPHDLHGFVRERNLSPRGDMREAASHLFDMLHDLDSAPASRIAVMPIPHHDLGRAINDRLTRAAARPASKTDPASGMP